MGRIIRGKEDQRLKKSGPDRELFRGTKRNKSEEP
jgi:hypothetical protein